MLRKYAAPGLPSQLAWGFNISKMSPEDLEYYRDRLDGVTRYLHPHQPWLLKDPRLSWLAPLWLEHLDQPLCVLVVSLQPGLLAAQLAEHQAEQGDGMEVGSSAHLERWTNATLSALRACVAVPTIIVPNTVLQPPLLQPFMAVLQQHLKLALHDHLDAHLPHPEAGVGYTRVAGQLYSSYVARVKELPDAVKHPATIADRLVADGSAGLSE
eukprot:gene6614-6842_t